MRWLACLFLPLLSLSAQVVDTSKSPSAVLRPVPVQAVQLDAQSFWGERRTVTLERSMPTMFDELEKYGTLNNFRRLEGTSSAPRVGPVYTDSDIYKWLEAAAFFVANTGANTGAKAAVEDLRRRIDIAVPLITAAQLPDGYLNTYYVDEKAKLRFTEMHRSHELYCLGHLLQAAVALKRANGDRRLLDAGIRYANYVLQTFGPEKQPALTGHPELEMGLIELSRETGDKRFQEFAGYLLSGVETKRLHLKESQTT